MANDNTVNLDDKKEDIKAAMTFWSTEIKKALGERFGDRKLGHVIIVFPFGEATGCSWISDANPESIIMLLHHLADRIEDPNAKIIKSH